MQFNTNMMMQMMMMQMMMMQSLETGGHCCAFRMC